MRKIILVLLYGPLLLSTAACSKPGQANNPQPAPVASQPSGANATKTPPENIVTASATEVQISPNGTAETTVQVNIASGYHINGNPASKYQIATTLSVEPGDRITAGQPQYPPALTKKFSFSPEPITVYEGQAAIKVQLKAAEDAAPGSRGLRARLRVQPCDDQACYPPRNIEVSLPITVK